MDTNEQLSQEIEYNLPYHYIPRLGPKSYVEHFRWSYSKQYISFLEYLLMNVEAYDNILEVGCGDGRLIGEIKLRYPYKNCIGIDYSDKAISLAKMLSPNVLFQCRNILEDIPINLRNDLILLIEVFEHIPLDDCNNFANNLGKLQSSGHHLFITVPHLNVKVSKKHFQHFDSNLIMDYYGSNYNLEKVVYLHSKNIFFEFIERILFNRYFSITNEVFLYYYYRIWRKLNFESSEQKCSRLFFHLIRK